MSRRARRRVLAAAGSAFFALLLLGACDDDPAPSQRPDGASDDARSGLLPDAATREGGSVFPLPGDGGADARTGDAGSGDAIADATAVDATTSAPPQISNVWPSRNFVGAAVLVMGENFKDVTGARIGGQPAVMHVLAGDEAAPPKLMITVPNTAVATDAGLMLTTDAGASVAVPFEVTPPTGALRTPYVPLALPMPGGQVAYPPISNTWHDECGGGSDLFRQVSDDGTMAFFITDQGSVGSFDRSTGLFRLARNTGSPPYDSYIGVYSDSRIPSSARLVLFPTSAAGNQHILFVCIGSSSLECRNDETTGEPLSDAGPRCD